MRDFFIVWIKLTPEQETERREWARTNYKVGQDIDGRWHPVIQDECVKMNSEYIDIGLTPEQQDIINNES